MDTIQQLKLLSQDMDLEADGEGHCQPIVGGKGFAEIPISEAVMPNGRRIKLLKTMLTSACERNCYYCPFRAGRDMRRATFKPEEMAKVFISLEKAKIVEGIFLSSGIIKGGVRTQDKLLDTADILRNKYQYRGYLHMKIMPGAEQAQVERAMQLASRVSVNLEAPNTKRLGRLAPLKEFTEELLTPLMWIEQIRKESPPQNSWNGQWASSATQFVVGAAGESDLELLSTSEKLFNQARLKRIYYSGFNPISDTPLDYLPRENPWRQHRLYQSSYLFRDYGFTLEEMPFSPEGNLPLDIDPKLAWAQSNLLNQPMEINRAEEHELLRIPGIGPKAAKAIMNAQGKEKLRSLGDLKRLGIHYKRAIPFILLDGKQPAHQQALFSL